MEITYGEPNNLKVLKGLVVFLILVAIVAYAVINSSKSVSKGWEAAEIRDCLGGGSSITARINNNQFMRFCQLKDGDIGVQLLQKNEKNNYDELYTRREYKYKSLDDVIEFLRNHGFEILGGLP